MLNSEIEAQRDRPGSVLQQAMNEMKQNSMVSGVPYLSATNGK